MSSSEKKKKWQELVDQGEADQGEVDQGEVESIIKKQRSSWMIYDTTNQKRLANRERQLNLDLSDLFIEIKENSLAIILSFFYETVTDQILEQIKTATFSTASSLTAVSFNVRGQRKISQANWTNFKDFNFKDGQIDYEKKTCLKRLIQAKIKYLSLIDKEITAEEMQQISQFKRNLTQLNIERNHIKDQGMKYLFMEEEKEEKEQVQQAGFSLFSMLKSLKSPKGAWKLEKLTLNNCCIGNQGIKYLVRASLDNLKDLQIPQNPIDGEAINHLSKAKWYKLHSLELQIQLINSLEYLIRANWIEMQFMTIWYSNNYKKDLKTLLKSSWPNINVFNTYLIGNEQSVQLQQLKNQYLVKFRYLKRSNLRF